MFVLLLVREHALPLNEQWFLCLFFFVKFIICKFFYCLSCIVVLFFFFLCSHWQVLMDLLSIEMVGGNGQLLLVFRHLLDISMLQCVSFLISETCTFNFVKQQLKMILHRFLSMHDCMFLEVHLVVGVWWKIHPVSQVHVFHCYTTLEFSFYS